MQITQAAVGALAEKEPSPGLERIFIAHKDLVFRAAYSITGNGSDAEDVLQTVFLRLIRQENLGAIDNVSAYLHRSAVNASLDLLRSRRDTQTACFGQEMNVPEPSLPETAGRSLELRDWIRQALASLNPRWAEMFILRFVEDYSNREIARMMKTSSAVVAVVLHRTRAQLKKDYLADARGKR